MELRNAAAQAAGRSIRADVTQSAGSYVVDSLERARYSVPTCSLAHLVSHECMYSARGIYCRLSGLCVVARLLNE